MKKIARIGIALALIALAVLGGYFAYQVTRPSNSIQFGLVPPAGCDQSATTTGCTSLTADAILACYHQNPDSDANKPIPNNSVQHVKETSRMFISMPKDLYPKDILHSWTTVSGNATAGYISNGGLPGEAEGALPGCWSTYIDFEGSGEVDLRVKSAVTGAPDYFVRFIVSQ